MGDRALITDIRGIEGTWPAPPARLSFSGMRDIGACPRRWSLTRASYPALWDGYGYPSRPNVASIVGNVVHECLESIVLALVQNNTTSVEGAAAVGVLRSLGGYPAVIRKALDHQVDGLASNPRLEGRMDQLRRDLWARVPEIRQTVQTLLSTSVLVGREGWDGRGPCSGTIPSGNLRSQETSNGSFPEISLTSSRLGMTGRLDLVSVDGSSVHIIDYKTGVPRAHHIDQMRIYALLWWLRDDVDPSRPYATRLTLSYPGHDLDVQVPTAAELSALEISTKAQLEQLRRDIDMDPPEARPDQDTCRFCPVRHLCDPYWSYISGTPPVDGFADVRGRVASRNGPKSWLLIPEDGQQVVLRCADESTEFELDSWLRVVSAAVNIEPDTGGYVASIVSGSEVFVEDTSG